MTEAVSLPYRPRLADHALLRRHLINGHERLLIKDAVTDETIEISPPALEIILCADGTRDFGGLLLAATRRGAFRRVFEVISLLSELSQRGLLVDGIELGTPSAQRSPERPLERLPGYALSCDGNGTCCGNYSAVLFSPEEVGRARALVPQVMSDESDRLRGTLPERSSVPLHALAMTMIDGHCPYLAGDGRCRIQLAAGPGAKPRGCRIFPATFVDDGAAIRVSVSVECPCVLFSLTVYGGEPLVPAGVTREADLLPGSAVVRLPPVITVSELQQATRAELRAWSELILARIADITDPPAFWWSLADAVREGGLAESAVGAALAHATPPPALSLGFPLMKLASRAQAKEEALRALDPAPEDRTYQLSRWVSVGAQALLRGSVVEELLSVPPPHPEHERFYLEATIFGHHLVTPGLTLEQALRDRLLRLLLARQLGREIPPECSAHPAAPHPLVAVESLMQGQGLENYALV